MKESSEAEVRFRSSRKAEHIDWAVRLHQPTPSVFSDVHLVHDSLAEFDLAAIDTTTTVGRLTCAWPIVIGAMTGGHSDAERVNAALARIAARCELAMAVGSQRAALDPCGERRSFEVVREENPNGVVLANLSASCTPREASEAVRMIGADGIQLHLNGLQELLMPEGNHAVGSLVEDIAAIADALEIPVFVKEVGFGMTGRTARRLEDAGIAAVDIAGRGGTSFASIEASRAATTGARDAFGDWGTPTAVSLVEVVRAVDSIDVIAGGGLRDGHDVLKALVVGARAASLAGGFLVTLVRDGEEALAAQVEAVQRELRVGMAALGVHTIAGLRDREYVVTGDTAAWLTQRGVPLGGLSDAPTA